MRNFIWILSLTLLTFTFSCKKDPIPFPNDSQWIGLWENNQDAITIWENGNGYWITNQDRKDRDKLKSSPFELFKSKKLEHEGFVIIEDDRLKIGYYKRKKFNKIFVIDKPPTDDIDDDGNSFTYIKLDGAILKKTY